MFQVKINGQLSHIELEEAADFGEVMHRILKQVLTPELVITQVKLNGKELPADIQREYYPLSPDEIETIEIETVHPRKLAHQNLLIATDYLERLSPGMEKAAELFRIGDETQANKLYAQGVEGLRWLVCIADGTKQLLSFRENGSALSREDKESLQGYQDKLHQMVDEMLQAQEDQDWIMLADLLEYELVPLLKDWQGFLRQLSKGQAP